MLGSLPNGGQGRQSAGCGSPLADGGGRPWRMLWETQEWSRATWPHEQQWWEAGGGSRLPAGLGFWKERVCEFSCREMGEKALSPAEWTRLSRSAGKWSPG